MVLQKKAGEFKRGLQAGVSIAIGYFPIALTFGLLAKTTGLTLAETFLMSFIVYAGASQYMSLSLLSLGTGMIEIIFTTLIVNIRHFLMSASLNEKSEEDRPFIKAIYAFGITDETFSVAAVKEGKITTRFMFGLNLIAYLSWGIFSGVGHIIGATLPQTLQEGMSIALYAMFIGLLVPFLKKGGKMIYLAVMAALFNSFFTLTHLLSTGWSIVVASLLAAILVEFVVMVRKKQRGIYNE